MSPVKLSVARDQRSWSWISELREGQSSLPAIPAQLRALGWEGLQHPFAPPSSPALQLSVLLIWHLLPSNILYCSLERKCDVRRTWALTLALPPAL